MYCALCRQPMGYVHGHAACLRGGCPMFGVNQAECCSGEHGDCPATSMVAMAAGPETQKSMPDPAKR
jgi:hypothetical protein